MKPSGGAMAETVYLAQPQLPHLLNEDGNLDHASEMKWDLLCKSRSRSLMNALSPLPLSRGRGRAKHEIDELVCVFEHSWSQFTNFIPMLNIT